MKQEELIALREWQDFNKAYSADTPIDTNLTRHDIEKRRKQLEDDPIAWIQFFFPKFFFIIFLHPSVSKERYILPFCLSI